MCERGKLSRNEEHDHSQAGEKRETDIGPFLSSADDAVCLFDRVSGEAIDEEWDVLEDGFGEGFDHLFEGDLFVLSDTLLWCSFTLLLLALLLLYRGGYIANEPNDDKLKDEMPSHADRKQVLLKSVERQIGRLYALGRRRDGVGNG